eukprot:g42247.t1
MLHEMVPESAVGLTNVQEATLGATDTVDQVGGCIGEPLSDMTSLLWALDGGEGGGEVPEDWRITNVVPLFKGSRDNPENDRPVSLTLVVGKLLEKILRDKIYTHLEANRLISNGQHGFVLRTWCFTNLIEFFEEMTNMIDEGKAVYVVSMDFSKCFDKVPHGRL